MEPEIKDFGMGPVTILPNKEYTKDPMSKEELIAKNGILVVGTNSEGWHAGGAARFASTELGLPSGQTEGIGGLACGLVTLHFGMTKAKVEALGSPLMSDIELVNSFKRFVETAKANPDKTFYLTKVGLGIAGYPLQQIHKAFWDSGAPLELSNLVYPVEFEIPDEATKP